jgi:hypothetical protein
MASRAAASETERGEQAELTFALASTKPSEAAVPVRLLAACDTMVDSRHLMAAALSERGPQGRTRRGVSAQACEFTLVPVRSEVQQSFVRI